MQRSPKYRAWYDGEMYQVRSISWTKRGCVDCIQFCGEAWGVDPRSKDVELMLYAGLMDKNDIEMCEGDVIRWMKWDKWKDIEREDGFSAVDSIVKSCTESIGYIVWDQEWARLEVKGIRIGLTEFNDGMFPIENTFYDQMGQEFIWDELEIIGDRWANPELLEVVESGQM